ncbi:unnamed protein product [Nesidiocoris tenuis]|uniref:Uncharacterized protein n=1 Tax=Nesidiocoris tenuis TaxID=355587 RepID=A0A6H5G6N4_9HEMI|nr:unnamed protein product [Nesidiocoris tenuis]
MNSSRKNYFKSTVGCSQGQNDPPGSRTTSLKNNNKIVTQWKASSTSSYSSSPSLAFSYSSSSFPSPYSSSPPQSERRFQRYKQLKEIDYGRDVTVISSTTSSDTTEFGPDFSDFTSIADWLRNNMKPQGLPARKSDDSTSIGLRSGVHLSLPNGQAEDNLLRFALQLHNARWSALSNRISGDIFDLSGWRIPVFPVDFQKSRILGYCADGSDVAIDRVDQSGIAAFVVAKSTTIWNRYPMSIDRRTI